jgi:hypothetical protein
MERMIRILICLADGDLQPYRLRFGLMLVAGGPTASVVEPTDLRDAGAEVAQMILRSYEPAEGDA